MKKITIFLNKFILLMVVLLLIYPSISLSADKTEKAKNVALTPFFAFDDLEYLTSPDKRIGAKILVDPSKIGPSMASLIHLTYLPGAHIPSHRHVYVTEVIHVLEGNLTLRIADETKVLGANSAACILPRTFHELLNDSTDVVKFLQYYSPSGPEEEYRNWIRPDAEPPASSEAEKSDKKLSNVTQVITPSLPVVSGSPKTVTGLLNDSSSKKKDEYQLNTNLTNLEKSEND